MFIVVELQVNKDGTVGNVTNAYQDENQAWNKYYAILSAAATSSVYKHNATMFTEEGFIATQCFTHDEEKQEEA